VPTARPDRRSDDYADGCGCADGQPACADLDIGRWQDTDGHRTAQPLSACYSADNNLHDTTVGQ
jgi:hypothetical protein